MKRHRIASTLVSAAIAAALPGTANAVRIDYLVDFGYERDDNVTLSASDSLEQGVFRAGLGFTLEQNSSTVQASIRGRIDHRRYEEIYNDATDQMFTGRLDWMIVPERLGFLIEDNYGVNTISRMDPNSPDNRQQINVLSLGPNFYFHAGPALRGQAELRYINSDAEVTEDFNSDRIAAALRIIRSVDPASTLSFNLQVQHMDFANNLLVNNDQVRTEAFVGYLRQLNLFDLQLDAGYSFISFDGGDNHGSPLLRAELGWNPRERSRLSLNAEHLISDAATSALGAIDAETGVPPAVITASSTTSPYPYESKLLGIQYAYAGVRTTTTLHVGTQRLDYIGSTAVDEKSRTIGASASYQLRPDLVLRGYASANRIDYHTTPALRQEDRLYSLIIEKRWARHWSTALSYTRYERNGSSGGLPGFEQNVIYLNVAYSNR